MDSYLVFKETDNTDETGDNRCGQEEVSMVTEKSNRSQNGVESSVAGKGKVANPLSSHSPFVWFDEDSLLQA